MSFGLKNITYRNKDKLNRTAAVFVVFQYKFWRRLKMGPSELWSELKPSNSVLFQFRDPWMTAATYSRRYRKNYSKSFQLFTVLWNWLKLSLSLKYFVNQIIVVVCGKRSQFLWGNWCDVIGPSWIFYSLCKCICSKAFQRCLLNTSITH